MLASHTSERNIPGESLMAIELAWYMSCDGDSAHIGQKFADHPPSYGTFTRIAQNAERSGQTRAVHEA